MSVGQHISNPNQPAACSCTCFWSVGSFTLPWVGIGLHGGQGYTVGVRFMGGEGQGCGVRFMGGEGQGLGVGRGIHKARARGKGQGCGQGRGRARATATATATATAMARAMARGGYKGWGRMRRAQIARCLKGFTIPRVKKWAMLR